MTPPGELVAFMREMKCWETEFFDQRKKPGSGDRRFSAKSKDWEYVGGAAGNISRIFGAAADD